MPGYPNPLNEQDCAALTALGKSCHATAELIRDCKECGLPVEEQEAANEAQAKLAEALKRKFFPTSP
jgi:hypothetical protein